MAKKNYNQMSFITSYVEKRKINDSFFKKINVIINWEKLSKKLEKYYNKGTSVSGRKAYPGLLLFKKSLLQTWYGLSDYQIESQVNDRISFMRFCGLRFEDEVPDHSALCRFRKILNQTKAYEPLLNEINSQLKDSGILVKKGVIVDASITPTLNKPKGKKMFEVKDQNPPKLKEVKKKGVDEEANWTRKGGKLSYGYKKHYMCDAKTSFVLSVCTSAANEHDSIYMQDCIEKAKILPGSRVYADKGYCGSPNSEKLAAKRLKDGIQRKNVRGKKLNEREKHRNKLISKIRYKVERIFGGIKKWFKAGICRYIGKEKTHGQHVLEALCYNIKIAPGVFASNLEKR